jgi:hypothetical protein
MSLIFDLRAVVADVLDTSDATDPEQLAREVLARIPDDDLRIALRQALPTVVRHQMSLARIRGGDPTPLPTGGPSRPVRNSAAMVREAWRRHLNDRLRGVDGYKRLRDFTVADCEFAADLRYQHAAGMITEAERLDRLRKALIASGAATVGDLDDDTIGDVWGAAA